MGDTIPQHYDNILFYLGKHLLHNYIIIAFLEILYPGKNNHISISKASFDGQSIYLHVTVSLLFHNIA